MNLYYKKRKKQQSKYSVIWKSTRIFRMAEGGARGGQGGGGGSSEATTRIDVLDPHIVQMMRDVMSAEESAQRLYPNAGAGGGGGGGGSSGTAGAGPGNPQGGATTSDGADAERCIVTGDGASGAYGRVGGTGDSDDIGGAGGGGAGGTGGALVIVTTTPEADLGGTLTVAGGTGGTGGINWTGTPPQADSGTVGLKVYIQV